MAMMGRAMATVAAERWSRTEEARYCHSLIRHIRGKCKAPLPEFENVAAAASRCEALAAAVAVG